jgi:hypothetical protein
MKSERIQGMCLFAILVMTLAMAACEKQTEPDRTAPSTPTGLQASYDSTAAEVILSWESNTESDLAGYNVYRSTSLAGPYIIRNNLLLRTTMFTDRNVVLNTNYYYVVTAVDNSENESVYSQVATIYIYDTIAPDPPTGLTVDYDSVAVSVVLDWAENSESDIDGYNVYRSLITGGAYEKHNADLISDTSYEDSLVSVDSTYYYVVTAVDNSHNESGYSAESSIYIPRTTNYCLEEAWNYFQIGQFDEAIDFFTSAIALNPQLADAYHGLGWCYGNTGSLTSAVTNFRSALSYDSQLIDAHAGLAFVYSALEDYDNVVVEALIVIGADAYYVFQHDTAVTIADIRLLLAQSYFFTQQYSEAQAQVDLLNPSNGLDPGDPNSWVVEGVRYQTYQEALLAEIMRLFDVL